MNIRDFKGSSALSIQKEDATAKDKVSAAKEDSSESDHYMELYVTKEIGDRCDPIVDK